MAFLKEQPTLAGPRASAPLYPRWVHHWYQMRAELKGQIVEIKKGRKNIFSFVSHFFRDLASNLFLIFEILCWRSFLYFPCFIFFSPRSGFGYKWNPRRNWFQIWNTGSCLWILFSSYLGSCIFWLSIFIAVNLRFARPGNVNILPCNVNSCNLFSLFSRQIVEFKWNFRLVPYFVMCTGTGRSKSRLCPRKKVNDDLC